MIVAPPFEVQQRAWECAYELREHFADRLPIEGRVRAEVAYRLGPDRLGWHEISDTLRLYASAVPVRV